MAKSTDITGKAASAEKPKNFWNGALKMVRGENTTDLIETFTAEMTLVAEGLCEDQSNLRGDVDKMVTETDRRLQAMQSQLDAAETSLEEERKAHDQDVTELRNRLAVLEKKSAVKPVKEKERKGNMIRDLTVLVSIAAGAWILVTLLNKLL